MAIAFAGVILVAAGDALQICPLYVLGNRLSGLTASLPCELPRIAPQHPRMGLAFRSWAGVLLAAMLFSLLRARIMKEALPRAQFGAQDDAYRARASRLIAGVF
jgi:protein-S-isoprenylcysteine O-methyltransferase Ste14